MRKYFALMVAGVVIVSGFIPTTAVAQEASRGEVYGGFLWTTGLTSGISSLDMFGAVGEGTGYVNDWFGISGEIGWSTGEEPEFPGLKLRESRLSFAAGPRFRFVNDSIVTPSLRVLVGGWRRAWEYEGVWNESYSYNELVMFFGGAVDILASERIAVRVQPDLMVWPDEDVIEWGFRLSTGVVIGF